MDPKTLEFYQTRSAEWASALPHDWGPELDAFLDLLEPRAIILELGCGEAHQSAHLQRLCAELYGVDVSSTAIGRAQTRLPQSRFAAGDIFAQPWGRERGRFDLVVACEVLYYVSDIQRTIDEMNFLGKSCFVTIFAPAIRRVGPFIEQLPAVRKDWFGAHGTEWVVAFWRSPSHGA